MNIIAIIQEQRRLDLAIKKDKNINYNTKFEDIIALYIELGEAMNEWGNFKYWKKGRVTFKDNLIEELADCLSFAINIYPHDINDNHIKALSKYIKNNYSKRKRIKNVSTDIIEFLFLQCFKLDPEDLIMGILELSYNLGFEANKIEKAYYKKNKKNWKRLKDGY